MAFIQPCFIRKNTPELRKKLEELGYLPPSKVWYNENFAICTIYREYITCKIDDDFERIVEPTYLNIDCGTNEELFLALAALRDDTDKWQMFVFDGIDVPDYFLQKGDMWICTLDKHLVENCHKATVEELIEHFKK
jgi:hypothetical protein